MSGEEIAGMVSVVIPTRNRPVLLRRAMQSVLAQDWRNLELIVVDDASDAAQNVGAVVEEMTAVDTRIRYLRQAKQSGVSAARNRGIAEARGSYIAFQDDDDEWIVDKLSRQVSALEVLGDGFVLVGGSVIRVSTNSAPRIFGWPRLSDQRQVDDDRFVDSVCAFMQTALLRSKALKATGGFDQTIVISEDWELCLRLREHGQFAAISDVVAISYESPTGLLSRVDLRIGSYRSLLQKHENGLLRSFPRAISTLHYETAKACGLLERRKEALVHAFKAIGAEPRYIKYWLSIPVLVAGPSLIQSMIEVRRLMNRMIRRRA